MGAAFYPVERITLALDVRWMQYSEGFNIIKAKLTRGTNADINEINGSDALTSRVVEGWSDIFVVAAGGSIEANDWLTLRLGYNFSTDPFEKDNIGPGSTPFLLHHITAGASFKLGRDSGPPPPSSTRSRARSRSASTRRRPSSRTARTRRTSCSSTSGSPMTCSFAPPSGAW